MPYLHYETNEGRIKLSNAIELSKEIKRTVTDSTAKPRGEDNTTSVLVTSEPDDDSPSKPESDTDNIREMAGKKVHGIKAKLASFRRTIRKQQKELWKQAIAKPSEEDYLIKAYLMSDDHRIHIRRTLDQFYLIGMENTEGRDTNQVVQRHAVRNPEWLESEKHGQSP